MLNLDIPDFRNMEKLIDGWMSTMKVAGNTFDYDKESFISLTELSLTGSVKIGWEGAPTEVKEEVIKGESRTNIIDRIGGLFKVNFLGDDYFDKRNEESEYYIEKMDGYNPYSWNQFYNQNAMVYPPQQEEFGYDNRRNFDYHYQMPQVPSYYQDWSHSPPRNVVQPQHNFQPHQEYYSSVSSSSNEGLSVLELMRRRIQREGSSGLPKDKEATTQQ
ncbi:hypothetical protein ACS0TY_018577 [Phlomoides rotata]